MAQNGILTESTKKAAYRSRTPTVCPSVVNGTLEMTSKLPRCTRVVQDNIYLPCVCAHHTSATDATLHATVAGRNPGDFDHLHTVLSRLRWYRFNRSCFGVLILTCKSNHWGARTVSRNPIFENRANGFRCFASPSTSKFQAQRHVASIAFKFGFNITSGAEYMFERGQVPGIINGRVWGAEWHTEFGNASGDVHAPPITTTRCCGSKYSISIRLFNLALKRGAAISGSLKRQRIQFCFILRCVTPARHSFSIDGHTFETSGVVPEPLRYRLVLRAGVQQLLHPCTHGSSEMSQTSSLVSCAIRPNCPFAQHQSTTGSMTRVFRFVEVTAIYLVVDDVGQSEAQERLIPMIVLLGPPHRSALSTVKRCPNHSQGVPGITPLKVLRSLPRDGEMAKFHSLGVTTITLGGVPGLLLGSDLRTLPESASATHSDGVTHN
ncbi:hypothetical protein C8R43DRAFT_944940 [Mycena crocata]|nr:hypothetical protein C8R43DRAFT_944940 [Mycena crocata]